MPEHFVQLHLHFLIVVMRFSVKISSSLFRHSLPCLAIRKKRKKLFGAMLLHCVCCEVLVRENLFSIMSFRSFRLAESLDTLAAL